MQVVFQNFIKKSNSLGYLKSKKDAKARKYSNEAALSLRSRRSGTKFANPASPRVCSLSISTNVFQGASFGIRPRLR